jgi:RluA family pseudouridine synthase
MAKPDAILLDDGTRLSILYEDRSVLAIDKPAGWMLIPDSWDKTDRNLQLAINSSVAAGAFWAKSRSITFLRYLHRLDGDTSGILLFGRSRGAVHSFSRLFESREIEKRYLAVVHGQPKHQEWTCQQSLSPDPSQYGRVKVDHRDGKDAETRFKVLARLPDIALLEARPVTGRTHQIRVHAAQSGLPLLGDSMYGAKGAAARLTGLPPGLALRAYFMEYKDPFTRRPIWVKAPVEEFLRAYGFKSEGLDLRSARPKVSRTDKPAAIALGPSKGTNLPGKAALKQAPVKPASTKPAASASSVRRPAPKK